MLGKEREIRSNGFLKICGNYHKKRRREKKKSSMNQSEVWYILFGTSLILKGNSNGSTND